MSADPDRRLSAQVILSDPGAAPGLAQHFRAAGFQTGPLVGTSFAIEGPPTCFESEFGPEGHGAAESEREAELPLDGLPAELAASVEAIAVSGAPDFGPANP